MKHNPQKSFQGNLHQLRVAAEASLAQTTSTVADVIDKDKLLQELQVHQIELEMQNEELRRMHLALEESRDSYLDLFEFSPIGFLTLTAKGLIT